MFKYTTYFMIIFYSPSQVIVFLCLFTSLRIYNVRGLPYVIGNLTVLVQLSYQIYSIKIPYCTIFNILECKP